MKTIVLTCDKCKQSKSEADIIPITITYPIRYENSTATRAMSIHKDICKSCLEQKGLLTEIPKENADEILKKNTRTFEDKLLEILEDLGVSFCE